MSTTPFQRKRAAERPHVDIALRIAFRCVAKMVDNSFIDILAPDAPEFIWSAVTDIAETLQELSIRDYDELKSELSEEGAL